MLDLELIAMLVCPESRQDVALASADDLNRLNSAIARGELKNVAGEVVRLPLEGALIRADGAVGYPIRDDIPIMLIPSGLVLTASNSPAGVSPHG